MLTSTDMEFYGDESFGPGKPGSEGCYVVAGYFTVAEVWAKLSRDWQQVLDQSPTIKYFHMAECHAAISCSLDPTKRGQFVGFSPSEANMKCDALISVIEKYGVSMSSVSATTTWDAFRHGLPEFDQKNWRTPFYPCVMSVLECFRALFRDVGIPVSPVAFTFDDRTDKAVVLEAWDLCVEIKKELATIAKAGEDTSKLDEALAIMGRIAFTDDKRCLPLQCADLLAWHVRREYIKPPEDHGRTLPRYSRLKHAVYRSCSILEPEGMVRASREALWKEAREFVLDQIAKQAG